MEINRNRTVNQKARLDARWVLFQNISLWFSVCKMYSNPHRIFSEIPVALEGLEIKEEFLPFGVSLVSGWYEIMNNNRRKQEINAVFQTSTVRFYLNCRMDLHQQFSWVTSCLTYQHEVFPHGIKLQMSPSITSMFLLMTVYSKHLWCPTSKQSQNCIWHAT